MGSGLAHGDRWLGTIAFSSLGLLFGVLVPFGLVISDQPLGLVVVLGVPFAALNAVTFGFVAWQSYDPPTRLPDTPATRRVAMRSAAAVIVARVAWYVGVVLIAVIVVPDHRTLGIDLVITLAVVSIAAVYVISRRLRRLAPKPSTGGPG